MFVIFLLRKTSNLIATITPMIKRRRVIKINTNPIIYSNKKIEKKRKRKRYLRWIDFKEHLPSLFFQVLIHKTLEFQSWMLYSLYRKKKKVYKK